MTPAGSPSPSTLRQPMAPVRMLSEARVPAVVPTTTLLPWATANSGGPTCCTMRSSLPIWSMKMDVAGEARSRSSAAATAVRVGRGAMRPMRLVPNAQEVHEEKRAGPIGEFVTTTAAENVRCTLYQVVSIVQRPVTPQSTCNSRQRPVSAPSAPRQRPVSSSQHLGRPRHSTGVRSPSASSPSDESPSSPEWQAPPSSSLPLQAWPRPFIADLGFWRRS